MGLGSHIAEGLAPIVDLIYPPRCPICGDSIAEQGGLCVECWSELAIPSEPSCAGCGRPFANDQMDENAQCAPCLANPPKHSGISAATIYNDASRKLILAFKHGRKIGIAPLLSRLIAAKLPAKSDFGDEPVLAPVPLHRWRLWSRGYNQAAMLARELERQACGELMVDALERIRPTPSLGGLGRRSREKTLRGAIRVAPSKRERLRGRDIVLVDDVLTSGATSDACVSALLKSGAKSVRIACFARVLDEALYARVSNLHEQKSETPEVQRTPGAT